MKDEIESNTEVFKFIGLGGEILGIEVDNEEAATVVVKLALAKYNHERELDKLEQQEAKKHSGSLKSGKANTDPPQFQRTVS